MKNKPLKLTTHTIVLSIAILLTVFSIIGSVAAAGLIPLVSDIDSLVKKENVQPNQKDDAPKNDQRDATSYQDEFRKIEFNEPRFKSVVQPKLGNCYNCGVVTGIESITKDAQNRDAENIDSLNNEDSLLNYLEAHLENARIIALDDNGKENKTDSFSSSEDLSVTYLIKVQMQDGTQHFISQDTPPEHEIGDKVRLTVGKIITA